MNRAKSASVVIIRPVPLVGQRRLARQTALDLGEVVREMIGDPAQGLVRRPGVTVPVDRAAVPSEPGLGEFEHLGHGGRYHRGHVAVIDIGPRDVIVGVTMSGEVPDHADKDIAVIFWPRCLPFRRRPGPWLSQDEGDSRPAG